MRKTETVECVRGVSQVNPSLTRSTVSVFRTGFVVVSVNSLCPVSVRTWWSLYGLCSRIRFEATPPLSSPLTACVRAAENKQGALEYMGSLLC